MVRGGSRGIRLELENVDLQLARPLRGARSTGVLIASLVEDGSLVRDQNVAFVILYSRCARNRARADISLVLRFGLSNF